MTNIKIVLIANIQLMIRNMSVEQAHLKAFSLVQLNFVNILNLMIEKMLEIIEQEHKGHLVHKVLQVQKVTPEQQVLKEYKVYKAL